MLRNVPRIFHHHRTVADGNLLLLSDPFVELSVGSDTMSDTLIGRHRVSTGGQHVARHLCVAARKVSNRDPRFQSMRYGMAMTGNAGTARPTGADRGHRAIPRRVPSSPGSREEVRHRHDRPGTHVGLRRPHSIEGLPFMSLLPETCGCQSRRADAQTRSESPSPNSAASRTVSPDAERCRAQSPVTGGPGGRRRRSSATGSACQRTI